MADTTSVEWVAKVFDAIHALTIRPLSTVSLFGVGESLGVSREQMTEDQLTAGEGIGSALVQALTDLAELRLVVVPGVSETEASHGP